MMSTGPFRGRAGGDEPPGLAIGIQCSLTDAERDRLMNWSEQVFPPAGNITEWEDTGNHIVATVNGLPVGHVGFDVFPLQIDGKEFRCIGIGGVVVVPEFQRRHLPGLMFTCLRQWRNQNHPGMLLSLFCPESLVGYYQRHGFSHCSSKIYFIQRGNFVRNDFPFMTNPPIHCEQEVRIPSAPW